LEALGGKSGLTTVNLYWLVKDRIPPEIAVLYWRPQRRKYLKPKSLEDQLRIGGQRLTFEYLVMLSVQGLVSKARIGKSATWSLTEAGLARVRNGRGGG